MSLDESVLRDVEAARCTLEALEDQTYEARAAFHQAIRRLHATGGSMREIATALGMSHQRVHQIIGTDGIVEVEASAVTEVSSLPVAAAAAVNTAEDACSFCGAPRREVDKLLAGPGPVFVCGSCVAAAAAVLAGAPGGTLRPVPVDEDATCSFCGNPSAIGGVMAEGPDGSPRICRQCTTTCERLLGGGEERPDRPAMRRNVRLRCSFCNSSANDTKRLIAGPGVYICEGCVAAGRSVVDQAQPAKGPRQVVLRPAAGEDHPCAFCATPGQVATAMVKGGRGRICEPCLTLCEEIILEDR
jgi:hypothetical protein